VSINTTQYFPFCIISLTKNNKRADIHPEYYEEVGNMFRVVLSAIMIIVGLYAQDGFKRGLYISFWAAGSQKKMDKIFDIIDKSDINTVVVDIKNEYGYLSFKGDVKEAKNIGAYKRRTIKDIDTFIKKLKQRNLYIIGRIVVFKDELFATNNPECAVRDSNGSIWRNHDHLAWSSPLCIKAHQYNIDIAKDTASKGFDEINFDYIRFPASKSVVFDMENNSSNRIKVISSFLQKANKELKPLGVNISVDTYGYVCWNKKDTGIGQNLKEMAKYVDFISPMLYPSGFHMGIPGFKNPLENMYETIYLSLQKAANLSGIDPSMLRPWLQAFKDYSFDRRKFGNYEIMLQTKASEDAKSNGWLLWNPSSYFLSKWIVVPQDTKIALTEENEAQTVQ